MVVTPWSTNGELVPDNKLLRKRGRGGGCVAGRLTSRTLYGLSTYYVGPVAFKARSVRTNEQDLGWSFTQKRST